MGNYAPPRFSTVGTQEKLEALGFQELDLDGATPAANALRALQKPESSRITVMHSYFNEDSCMAASIILQDHKASIVSMFMDGSQPVDPNSGLVVPYMVDEHSFMQTFDGGHELMQHVATDHYEAPKYISPPLTQWFEILPEQPIETKLDSGQAPSENAAILPGIKRIRVHNPGPN